MGQRGFYRNLDGLLALILSQSKKPGKKVPKGEPKKEEAQPEAGEDQEDNKAEKAWY